MQRVCPNPEAWNEVYKLLRDYAENVACTPSRPPTPLILNGWTFSNDVEKKERWDETVEWALANGCANFTIVPGERFYCTSVLSSSVIGPMGGPMFLAWDFERKQRPSAENLAKLLDLLSANWAAIVGSELARTTKPVRFSGAKYRNLRVVVSGRVPPPWGSWDHRSETESERRTFTKFRRAINNFISPHMVDHVQFFHLEASTEVSLRRINGKAPFSNRQVDSKD